MAAAGRLESHGLLAQCRCGWGICVSLAVSEVGETGSSPSQLVATKIQTMGLPSSTIASAAAQMAHPLMVAILLTI